MTQTQSPLEIRVLGELAVLRDGKPVALPQSKKTRALLGYLVLTGRPQRRARLCNLLWDVTDDPRGALRWSLSKLRPLVNDSEQRIVTAGDSVAFESAGARVDVLTAKTRLREDLGSVDTVELEGLAESFRGELLEGLDVGDFDEFQAWCLAEREDARSLRGKLLRALVKRLHDKPDRALPHARALVEIEPVDEQIRADLVAVLASAGRLSEARQQVEFAKRQLRELGANPTGALAQAAAALEGPRPEPHAASDSPTAGSRARPNASPTSPVITVERSLLVGRIAEQTRLNEVLQSVQTGREKVALVSGEPGMGKTTLLDSLLDSARRLGGTVLKGHAFEAEQGRPYGPWIDALRAAPPLPDTGSFASQLALLLPEMPGAPLRDVTQTQMFAAVVELISGHARQASPVVIALDDVQWMDEASAELLHYVARMNRRQAVLLVLTARSGEISDNTAMQRALRGLRREHLLEELALGPLSREDTLALVSGISADTDADLVYQQSAGNPLFAMELARSGPRDETDLPPTLAEVVRERVDRLSQESVALLQWASVLGPQASIALLEKLTRLPGDGLMDGLELLQRHALLTAQGDAYAFAHDVVRHAVYNDLSQPRRRLMHGRVAQLLHSQGASGEAAAADIAHHATLAGDGALAARACEAAGRRSLKLFAKRDALALARRGARHAAELPEPERTALTLDLWDVQLAAERPENADEVAAELETLSERALDAGDMEHARLGFHLLSYLEWEGGRSGDALRHMLHAEQVSRNTDDAQRADALAEAARCLVRLDRDLGHAQALLMEAKAVASSTGSPSATVESAQGMFESRRGQAEAARSHLLEGQRIARASQDRIGEFHALEWLAMMELLHGEPERARHHIARLMELGEKLRDGSEGPCARGLGAVTDYACGDEGALARVEAASEELRVVDAKQRRGFVLLAAAQVQLGRGEAVAALGNARTGLSLMEGIRHRSDTVWARALVARAAKATGDEAIAEMYAEEFRQDGVEGLAQHAIEAAQDVLNRA